MKYENSFVREVKEKNITDPLEILNWYRNLYHTEDNHTEHGIMAWVINDLFVKYDIKEKKKYLTAEDVNKMSRTEVKENYQLIVDSMKHWK